MTKTETKLLKYLAGAYYFILCLRDDAIRRKDGYYIGQTEGIDVAIKNLEESFPQFTKYFNLARKKAAPVVKQKEAGKAESPKGGKASKAREGSGKA